MNEVHLTKELDLFSHCKKLLGVDFPRSHDHVKQMTSYAFSFNGYNQISIQRDGACRLMILRVEVVSILEAP